MNLPAALSATVDGIAEVISGITWAAAPAYSPAIPGTYTFKPALPYGYKLADGVTLPAITVTVGKTIVVNRQIEDDAIPYTGSGTASSPYVYLVDGTNTTNSNVTDNVKVSWKYLNTIAGYNQEGLKKSGSSPVCETYEYREGNDVKDRLIWSWNFNGNGLTPITDVYKHPTYLGINVKQQNSKVYADFACHIDLWCGSAQVKLYVGSYFKDGDRLKIKYESGCGDNDQMHGTWKYTNGTWNTVIEHVQVSGGCIDFNISHGGLFSLAVEDSDNKKDEPAHIAVPPDSDIPADGQTPQDENNGGAEQSVTEASHVVIAPETDEKGKVSCEVLSDQMDAIVSKAITEAKEKPEGAAGITIEVKTDKNAKALEVSIPAAAIKAAAEGKVKAITVSSGIAAITFDRKTMQGLSEAEASGNIIITAEKVNAAAVSEQVREVVGNRPVFNFSVTDGEKAISGFSGNVTVKVPYQLAAGEDPNAVVIYYINGQGKLETVRNCAYDPETGTVSFTTTHFSKYAVGYNKVKFKDVSGWSEEYICCLAARNIVSGKGEGKYDPLASITRAEFIRILANMAGADLSKYKGTSFKDVKANDWYAGALEWAYKNGIILGNGGKFSPNACITRQDAAVLLIRYADKIAGYALPAAAQVQDFKDGSKISAYAKDAVTALQKAGIISGGSDGSFEPGAGLTRAQCAKLVAVLMKSMIGV